MAYQNKQRQRLRVLLLFNQGNKPDRERANGFLRHLKASFNVSWDVRLLNTSSHTLHSDCKKALEGWNVDAVVFSEYSLYEDLKTTVPSLKRAKHLIAIDSILPQKRRLRIHLISLDLEQLVTAAVNLLSSRGFGHFAYIGTNEPDEKPYSRKTELVFLANLKKLGIPPYTFKPDAKIGLTAQLSEISDWLHSLPKPCGVLAYSDNVAQRLLIACQLSNIFVPQQVAVIGVDNHSELCETCKPSLTSIEPDFNQSGFLAGQLLANMTAGEMHQESGPVRISYGLKEICERETTLDLRNAGRLANAILTIIRANGCSNLTVGQIAKRLGASVRLLEMRFKSVTGRTIRSELLAFRCNRLRERVIAEKGPLGELAIACGFRSANSAQIAFRRMFGRSMRSYRSGSPLS